MGATVAARLTALLGPLLREAGTDLEDLSVSMAGSRSVVRVVVDRDGGVSLDDVADVSRDIGGALDALDAAEPDVLGTAYVLEVSSPGVDRPLTEPRHWRRNVGRLVTAVPRTGATVTGRVARADADAVTLDVAGVETTLAYADLSRGTVQVEFSRPGVQEDP